MLTARALRRTLAPDPDAFGDDVLELMRYFGPAQPGQRVRAVPGEGLDVPIWILGSSLFGAGVAASLGLPYAFASHFAPAHMMDAIDLYRTRFRPSAYASRPRVMLGYNGFATRWSRALESEGAARRLLYPKTGGFRGTSYDSQCVWRALQQRGRSGRVRGRQRMLGYAGAWPSRRRRPGPRPIR